MTHCFRTWILAVFFINIYPWGEGREFTCSPLPCELAHLCHGPAGLSQQILKDKYDMVVATNGWFTFFWWASSPAYLLQPSTILPVLVIENISFSGVGNRGCSSTLGVDACAQQKVTSATSYKSRASRFYSWRNKMHPSCLYMIDIEAFAGSWT